MAETVPVKERMLPDSWNLRRVIEADDDEMIELICAIERHAQREETFQQAKQRIVKTTYA